MDTWKSLAGNQKAHQIDGLFLAFIFAQSLGTPDRHVQRGPLSTLLLPWPFPHGPFIQR